MNVENAKKMYRNSIRAIALFCVFAMFACSKSSSVAGKYVDEKKSENYTELKSDGTFLVHQNTSDFSGKYKIEGKRLILTLSSGEVVEGKIEGKTITDNEGGRLTKQ